MESELNTIFPEVITDIIIEYVCQLEHTEKFKYVCYEMVNLYWMRKKIILNIQFNRYFYPNFYSDLEFGIS